MNILSKNKKTLKTLILYFFISILAFIGLYSVSYLFNEEGQSDLSFIIKMVSFFFLIMSGLFGFSLGQVFVRLYRDKIHGHIEDDPQGEKTLLDHLHNQTQNYYTKNSEVEHPKDFSGETLKQTKNKDEKVVRSKEVLCYQCHKKIFNPYICKTCRKPYCSEHILINDHKCITS